MKPWFERAFSFDLPLWRFPLLVERLRGTPARVEEFFRDLPPACRTRHRGGAWSIQENLGHLLDLEPLWLGRVDDLLAGRPRLREADLTNRKTHEAGHDAAATADLLRAFRAARRDLVGALEAAGEAAAGRAALHPRLEQPMRLIDLVYFVAEHDDHHLARMRDLRRAFAAGDRAAGLA